MPELSKSLELLHLSRQGVSFPLAAHHRRVGGGSFCGGVILRVDLEEVIEHDEQHGSAAEEDGEGVEGGVGDHCCFMFVLCWVSLSGV